MEPLNLMVSLSHFAGENRANKRGLSTPAGRSRRTNPTTCPTDPQPRRRTTFITFARQLTRRGTAVSAR
ncbi:hypothetical protein AB0E69_09495 [Kribbella sp. NPDC026611]|uniref:hypothetical protein n=1 Tax=Kribbella sp. NPDC026611 TaxID=3154911 RepID=UPI0033D55219